jgi:hypothetical protein
MEPPICPYCNHAAKLIDSIVIYRVRSYGMMWHCAPCDAYVGVHKDSKEHVPLGRLANAELRKWKMKAHAAFDPLWKEQGLKRKEAYQKLADLLGIPVKETHIGMFDVDQCKRVIEVLGGRAQ